MSNNNTKDFGLSAVTLRVYNDMPEGQKEDFLKLFKPESKKLVKDQLINLVSSLEDLLEDIYTEDESGRVPSDYYAVNNCIRVIKNKINKEIIK